MKIIISEDQYSRLSFLRRSNPEEIEQKMDEIINLAKDTFAYSSPCQYDTYEDFFNAILTEVSDLRGSIKKLSWINDLDIKSIGNFLKSVMEEDLVWYYHDSCD